MMWVCRAGKKSRYFDDFIRNRMLALPWDGYNYDLSGVKKLEDFKQIVIDETGTNNRTSISNWSSQLYSFCIDMTIGDYALIPAHNSSYYVLARIKSNYEYMTNVIEGLCHVRKIEIVHDYIDRNAFPRNVQYSLGAYRTIFKCKAEDMVLEKANK